MNEKNRIKNLEGKKIERKIYLVKCEIEACEKDEKTRKEKFFGDPALIAHKLSELYEKLGDLYSKLSDVKSAVSALEDARKADLAFVKSEYSFDKKYLQDFSEASKLRWQKKIAEIKSLIRKN